MEVLEENSENRGKPEPLTVEMILRKSFKDSLKEYINNCSLAGARQMCDPEIGLILRLIWIAVFLTAIGTTGYFLLYIWSSTLTKPFIVTMESSTYPIGSIAFPAIAICNNNRISKKALAKLALEEFGDLSQNKESMQDIQNMLLNWGRLINYSYNETLRGNPLFHRVMEKYKNGNQRIEQIMRMLAPKCDEMILKCAWGGALIDCQSVFHTNRIGSRGHCCTFNYWATRIDKQAVKHQREPGYLYGLNVVLDPLVDDYAYALNAVIGFEVLILDPSHFADPNAGRMTQRLCEPNMALFLELKSTRQLATEEVRKYGIETRKCLFNDEGDSGEYKEGYSYSTCLVLCKVSTIYSLCKCTPFFISIREMQKGPVCTLENLRCLNKYREKFFYIYPTDGENTTGLEKELQDSLFCPECYPDCELTTYFTKSYEIPLSTEYYNNKDLRTFFLSSVNVTNKCYLSVYHPLPDANLDRLDVVYYWYEVLSNVGGFSGIIIGFSAVGGIEISYYFTIRLVRHLFVNYHNYH